MGLLEQLKAFGVGRRSYKDELFARDISPPRYGIQDLDEEKLCHNIIESACQVPGCRFAAETVLESERHYDTAHRYTCAQCRRVLPSPHLLDLHLQEAHDSFFAVMATRKPSYSCYIEECKEKFTDSKERSQHCVQVHKLPKDYRFDLVHNQRQLQKGKKNKKVIKKDGLMEVDQSETKEKIYFSNSKQKTFSSAKYVGKMFTNNEKSTKHMDIDEALKDLKESLQD